MAGGALFRKASVLARSVAMYGPGKSRMFPGTQDSFCFVMACDFAGYAAHHPQLIPQPYATLVISRNLHGMPR